MSIHSLFAKKEIKDLEEKKKTRWKEKAGWTIPAAPQAGKEPTCPRAYAGVINSHC